MIFKTIHETLWKYHDVVLLELRCEIKYSNLQPIPALPNINMIKQNQNWKASIFINVDYFSFPSLITGITFVRFDQLPYPN